MAMLTMIIVKDKECTEEQVKGSATYEVKTVIMKKCSGLLYGIKKLFMYGYSIEINALMMEAVSTYETSKNFYHTTWRNISEDSHLPVKDCCWGDNAMGTAS
jgi:hypothetical protein